MTERAIEPGWVRLKGGYWLDPKLLAVSLDAEALYVRGLGMVKMQGTDGVLVAASPQAMSVKIGDVERAIEELIIAGLWDVRDGNFVVPKWGRWQESAERIEERRAADRERLRRWRERQRQAREGGSETA